MTECSRREVLMAAGALLVAVSAPAWARGRDAPSAFGPFVAVTPDDEVIVYSPASEMGQGITTTLAMIVAEELDADWDRVRVEHAPPAKVYRRRFGPGLYLQETGGSTSTKVWHDPMRQAGAEARARLVAAAAHRFGCAPSACTVRNGVITHEGRTARFGELAHAARDIRVDPVSTKPASDYRLRGQAVARLDLRDKVTGRAQFGADVRPPGLLFATTQASPVFGGRVASVDDAAARALPGVRDVLVFDDFVAVVADHTWAAQQGLRALTITWDEGPSREMNTASLRQARLDAVAVDARFKTLERGEPLRDDDPRVIGGVYEVPYLEHLCMSPLNATAHVTADQCTLWAPTQNQTLAERSAKRITGLRSEAITVHTTLLGGGFGRRGYTDEVDQVLQIAMRVDGPVHLQWTREETTRQGRYRPAAAARMLGRVEDGRVSAVHMRLARQSEYDFYVPDFVEGWKLALRMIGEGVTPMPYAFDSYRLDVRRLEEPVPVGFWRAVSHSSNAFFLESFVDELAHATGTSPVAFREQLLADHPRHLGVLREAVDKAGPPPAGRSHGVAVQEFFGSICAQVVEISVDRGRPRVHRVVCALDCGQVVHPDGARAQVMGGVIYGLAAALYGTIDLDAGRVQQSNFHDAPILRMYEAPDVEVHLVASDAPPSGVGELGTPPVAPALYNAWFAATGQRIRRLPFLDALEPS